MSRSSTLAHWPILAFLGLLLTVLWGPEAISIVVETQGALTCRSSTLIILADSGPFHGHSQFWGLGVIFTIDEPRDAFMCRSSRLTVFVDSGPFRALLLTILRSQSDFHGC